jgi:hypothetical protein
MSSSKKVIAVIGATGGQGGSVVKSILADPKMSENWAIRGVTRDASKDSSKQLASRGVEVVEVSVHSSPMGFVMSSIADRNGIGQCGFQGQLGESFPRSLCCVCGDKLLGSDGYGARDSTRQESR